MKHTPRVFLDTDISKEVILTLPKSSAHHIFNVLRLKKDETLYVFNTRDGEWLAQIIDPKKNLIKPISLERKFEETCRPAVVFSLINHQRIPILLEKITELGVMEIFPVISEYTQSKNNNIDKFYLTLINASEQSKRLDVPKLHKPQKLFDFLDNYPLKGDLLVGDESLTSQNIINEISINCSFLIGPEGGFSTAEINAFEKYSFIKKVTICSNILRSETAAMAMLAIWDAKFDQKLILKTI